MNNKTEPYSDPKSKQARAICTRNLRVLVRHCEALSLKLAYGLEGEKCNPTLLAKLAQIVLMIGQLCSAIRLNEVFNHHLRLIERVKTEPVFRAHVRATIGESAIETWWNKYHKQYNPPRPSTQQTQSWSQSDYQWKPYGLQPVPGFVPPPSLTGPPRGGDGTREKRLFPPALFFPWQLGDRVKPAQKCTHNRRTQPEDRGASPPDYATHDRRHARFGPKTDPPPNR